MKKLTIFNQLKDALLGKAKKTTAPAPQKKQQTELYVFITVKGKKFHYTPNCSGLHSAKPVKMDISKAKKAGYTACDKCCYAYLHE